MLPLNVIFPAAELPIVVVPLVPGVAPLPMAGMVNAIVSVLPVFIVKSSRGLVAPIATRVIAPSPPSIVKLSVPSAPSIEVVNVISPA